MTSETLPTFLTNLISIAKRAQTLSSRQTDQVAFKQNLVDNTTKIYSSKTKWCDFVIEHMKEEHAHTREKMINAKQKLDESYTDFIAAVSLNLSDLKFFEAFLHQIKHVAKACCNSHETARWAYTDCVETDLKLTTRSLLLCRESMSSKNKLVEKFELATVVIARLSETCSLVGAQSTTMEQTSKTLNEHFDHLNDLNELLAERINTFISAMPEAEKESALMVIKTIQELESIVDELLTVLTEERQFIKSQDFYQVFESQIASTQIHTQIMATAHQGEVERIKEHGAVKRLELYSEQTGVKATEAQQKLAVESDTLGVTLQNIYYALNDSDSMDLRTVMTQAPAAILEMAKSALSVLKEESQNQQKATDMQKEALSSGENELVNVSLELDDIAANPSTPAGELADKQKKVSNILHRSVRLLEPDAKLLLGLGDAQKTHSFRSALQNRIALQEMFQAPEKPEESKASAQQLSTLAKQVTAEISEYKSSLDAANEQNQKMLVALNQDIHAQVDSVSSRLIDAANAALAEGLDDNRRRSILDVCESVETLAEFGSTFIPMIAEENPFSFAEEPPAPLPENDHVPLMHLKYDPPPNFQISIPGMEDEDYSFPLVAAPTAVPTIRKEGSWSEDLVLSSAEEISQSSSLLSPDRKSSTTSLTKSPSFIEREKITLVIKPADPNAAKKEKPKVEQNEAKVGVVRRAIRNIESMLEDLEKSQPEGLLQVLRRRDKKDSHDLSSEDVKGQAETTPLRKDTSRDAFRESRPFSTVFDPPDESIPKEDGMSADWVNWRRQYLNLPPDNIWNEQGTLSFGKQDGKLLVKAGTLNQILIHLTSPLDNAADALAGSDFYRTFMMTLQTFTEPEVFVQKMVERYNVPAPPDGVDLVQYEQDVRNPVQMRVCNLLKKWIISRYDQDLAHKPQLIEDLFTFVANVAIDSEYLSKNLKQCLTLYISGERFLYHKKLAQGETQILTGAVEDAPFFHAIVSFDPREVAQQLTLLDAENFRAIRLYELAGQAWNKKDANVRAPNLTRMINHTNRLSLWVASCIVEEPKVRRRKKIMTNMILLLQYLRSLNNFHGVMGVLAGLSMAAVSRLKHTIKDLNSKVKKIQTDIEEEFSSLGSFRIYRENLKKATAPVIPFMGVMLSDLTFIEDGNPNFTENGLINWIKRSLLYSILSQFLEHQRVCYYSFPEKRTKEGVLVSIEQHQTTPSQLYSRSLEIEPRSGELPEEVSGYSTFGSLKKILLDRSSGTLRKNSV